MVNLLIDTCVWLDIPKDPRQVETLNFLAELCKLGEVAIIVPQAVLDEFTRNKARIVQEVGQSLSSTLKRAREAIEKFGDPKKRRQAMEQLSDVDHKLPLLGEAAVETLGSIEALLKSVSPMEATDAITLRAAKRAIEGKAPCHRGKNSINDAILIESYVEATCRAKGQRFVFVTHNKRDFSRVDGDQRQPHPDIAPLFSKIKSRYFISLVDALKRIRPDVKADLLEQEFNWTDEVRSLSEIQAAMEELWDKIWYDRHKCYEHQIAIGKVKLVKTYNQARHNQECVESVWKRALAAAKKKERKYGVGNLGPWSKFEWGMMNGKLSALRWALGDEWDMLDT
jgi:hypothetical protein